MDKESSNQIHHVKSQRHLHPFFTPTHVQVAKSTLALGAGAGAGAGAGSDTSATSGASGIVNRSGATSQGKMIEWQSRRARKGRYAPKAKRIQHHMGKEETVFLRIQEIEDELRPQLLVDISFWIAIAFTLGSAVWVVNGFLVWLPLLYPEMTTTTISTTASALAFVGGSIFEIGSYLMVVEALDRGRETNFGTALSRMLHKEGYDMENGTEWPAGAKGFVWWGKPLWHDMGYDAALVQLFAASVFWIATLTGLPGVIPGLSTETGSVAIIDVFYWTPQVIGGTGFIISSLILMLEVQKQWYLPRPLDIGWHVGFWNLIGSAGFMLCGAFGYSSNTGIIYESDLATFWGSWAFLIGSGFQLWEVIWREPPQNAQQADS